jgi:hypothetical protein
MRPPDRAAPESVLGGAPFTGPGASQVAMELAGRDVRSDALSERAAQAWWGVLSRRHPDLSWTVRVVREDEPT